jgi:ParB-like chromosome segregation protein Spo0J
MSDIKVGIKMKKIRVQLMAILPVRQIKNPQKNIRRLGTIVTSIKEVGMVDPLMVRPHKSEPGSYLLLDGHLRYFALKELGETSAECIIADDVECFTYNTAMEAA